ncbi:MAG: hypothetical protein ABIO72_03250 [Patescibacteria group bacterium]
MRKALGVFLLSLAVCAAFISWSAFPDPDSFYHAKASLLVWQHGPIHSFPWLDLTTLGTNYMDQHFLFHVFEAPFVGLLGLHLGARIVAILLAAICLTTIFLLLRWLKIRYAGAWMLLLMVSSPFMVRLLLAKASPIAITLFVLGLAAAWKRKPFLVALIGFLFALTHGGWVYLIGSIFLMGVGDALYRWVMEEQWKLSYIASSVAVCVGVAFGLLIHPNFPQDISLLWIQIVKIGLQTPFNHVILGSEWLPVAPGWMLSGLALWLIALGGGIAAMFMARRDPFDREAARGTIVFAFPVAALLALTFKSRRSVEYLVPAIALWVPWIWNMVDLKKLRDVFKETLPKALYVRTPYILALVIGALAVKNIQNAYLTLHDDVYPDAVYADAFSAISSRANIGDRVFHSDWDEFPMLWSLDDRLKYVVGLDPTFLYEASSTLSDAYRDVTWGQTTTTPAMVWSVVHDRLGARFVFIDKRDHTKLYNAVKEDERYELLRDTDQAATFEVKL